MMMTCDALLVPLTCNVMLRSASPAGGSGRGTTQDPEDEEAEKWSLAPEGNVRRTVTVSPAGDVVVP